MNFSTIIEVKTKEDQVDDIVMIQHLINWN